MSSIEILEPRIAPAGIIAVSVSSGALVLKSLSGAGGDEAITIAQAAPGELTLTPGIDTQLRFGTVTLPAGQAQTIEALFGGVTIAMGEGNDSVTLDNLQMAKAVSIDLGGGSNALRIEGNSSFGALKVKAGAGVDVVTIVDDSLTVAGAFSLALGEGSNQLVATLARALTVGGDFALTSGKGNDEFSLSAGRVAIGGKFTVATGAGSDELLVFTPGGSFQVAREVKVTSLGGAGADVDQDFTADTFATGAVTLSIGPSSSSNQDFDAFSGLLVQGSFTATIVGNAAGDHRTEVRGGAATESAIFGNLTFKGQSFLIASQIGLVTGNLSAASGAKLQLLSFQGQTSLDDAFRVGGSVTVDTTKAKTTLAQSSINFGRFVSDGPLKVRDGLVDVTVAFVDSRLLGAVTLVLGAGGDTVNLDSTAFPEPTIFFGPVLIQGGDGADTFNLGGANAGDNLVFRNKIVVDGGTGTDTLTQGPQVTFAGGFPLVQLAIP